MQLRSILAHLCFGSLVTAAIAAAAAIWPPFPADPRPISDAFWPIAVSARGWPARPDVHAVSSTLAINMEEWSRSSWYSLSGDIPRDLPDSLQVSVAVGFPFRAFAGSYAATGWRPLVGGPASQLLLIATHDAIPLPASFTSGPCASIPILPVRPLWFGLCLDLACWAIVAGLISACLRHARRRVRRKRGLCPGCGQIVQGGQACPECGMARSQDTG